MKMKKFKIIVLIIIILFLVATGAGFFAVKKAHNWFQSEAFETYLQTKINEYGNIHLAFGNRTLRFFPIPQVVVEDVDFIINDVQKISIPCLSFSMKLRTLFTDKPVIDSITLENPVFSLLLPDPFAASETDKEFTFPDMPAILHGLLKMAKTDIDMDELRITNGRANIRFDNGTFPEIIITNMLFDADMSNNRLALEINLRSNHMDSLTYKGLADFDSGALQGAGTFNNAKLGVFIPDGLFVKESVEIDRLDLSADFQIVSNGQLRLDLTNLNINGRITDDVKHIDPVFENSQLSIELTEQTIKLTSTGINCVTPKGRLTADLSINLADLEKPQIVMDLKGYALNLKEAGAFLGIMDDDAAHLFNKILLDGEIPDIHFYIACDNFDDIFRYRKFELDFGAQNATVDIFPISLYLEKITGRGQLKDGWLTLTDTTGSWSNSNATDCNLKLDLNTDDYNFGFHSTLDFDLAELKKILTTVNPKFSNALLDRMDNLNGRVPSELDIQFADNKETITVISQPFDATGTYKTGKLPVTIKNALFTYADNQKIEFSAPSMNFGKSKVTNLKYAQDLTPAKVKNNTAKSDVSAGGADVRLNETLPVVMDLAGNDTPEFLRTWQFQSGELILTGFKLNGQIEKPKTWLIQADVAAKDVSAFNKNFAEEPFTSPKVTCSIKTNGEVVTFNDIGGQLFFAKDNQVNVKGRAQTHAEEIVLDLDINAPKIDFDLLLKIMNNDDKNQSVSTNITGKVDFTAQNAIFLEWTWAPLQVSVDITRDRGYFVKLEDVALCGIALKGWVNLFEDKIDLQIEPWVTDGRMEDILPCLSKDITYAEGDMSIKGLITAKGPINKWSENLNGEFSLYSDKGRILKLTLLADLLSIINVTEFYKGSLPNFQTQGFDYTELLVKAKITNGLIVFEDTTIDSSFFTAVASGNYDVDKDHLSIDILVAPFKTVDRLISYIPVIGHIMGNNLVALPFRATGPVEKPSIIPLPPDAVAGSLVGILKRTITSPISIFDNALIDLLTQDPNQDSKNPNKQPGVSQDNTGLTAPETQAPAKTTVEPENIDPKLDPRRQSTGGGSIINPDLRW